MVIQCGKTATATQSVALPAACVQIARRRHTWIRLSSYSVEDGTARYAFVFFFQAEDGIRDLTVTGVQTCALPISGGARRGPRRLRRQAAHPAPPPRARLRADVVPLRHPGRLRGVPRPATPPPAHARAAATHAPPRPRHARAGRGGRPPGGPEGRPPRVAGAPR